LAAVQWNFVGNWAITFDRPRDAIKRRYLLFHGVCVVGLVIYEIVLALTMLIPNMPVLLANFGAIVISSLWNFVGSDSTAFAETLSDEPMTEREAAPTSSISRSAGKGEDD
jgi:dolichol-phosphate mannosyltransferase